MIGSLRFVLDKIAAVAAVNDAGRGKWGSIIGMTLALLRNYDPFQAPTHFVSGTRGPTGSSATREAVMHPTPSSK